MSTEDIGIYDQWTLADCPHVDEISKAWKEHAVPILFMGPPGTRKTTTCHVLLKQLAKAEEGMEVCYRQSALFRNVADIRDRWNELIAERGHAGEIIHTLKNVNVLVMDDLGQRSPTDAFLEFMYSILDWRINHRLRTIYTTNLNADAIYSLFGSGFGSRIFSGRTIKFLGKDFRVKI